MFPIYHNYTYPSTAELQESECFGYNEKDKSKGVYAMNLHFDLLEDKIEFFEATNIKTLESKIASQIEVNKAIMLHVQSVNYQMHVNENGQTYFTASVHFKLKKL
jgi:hypothetical protein